MADSCGRDKSDEEMVTESMGDVRHWGASVSLVRVLGGLVQKNSQRQRVATADEV